MSEIENTRKRKRSETKSFEKNNKESSKKKLKLSSEKQVNISVINLIENSCSKKISNRNDAILLDLLDSTENFSKKVVENNNIIEEENVNVSGKNKEIVTENIEQNLKEFVEKHAKILKESIGICKFY
jgi:hypothetical protein